MDNARVFISLRPTPVFTGNSVNYLSLETIEKTFQGAMPTQEEMDTEWIRLQAEDGNVDLQKTKQSDIESQFGPTLKAFALVVLSEINALRVAAGLSERTISQLKSAIKEKL